MPRLGSSARDLENLIPAMNGETIRRMMLCTDDRHPNDIATEGHIDAAQQKLDLDRVTETVRCQPSQSQAVLYSMVKLYDRATTQKGWTDKRMLTGDVFETYASICLANNLKPLTQRRVSDLIGELDMLGIITAKVVSNGRYGRTRDISLAVKDEGLLRIKLILQERFGE